MCSVSSYGRTSYIFRGMRHIRTLARLLVAASLLTACGTSDPDADDPLGKWEATIHPDPVAHPDFAYRLTLDLERNGTHTSRYFVPDSSTKPASGFDGGWTLKGDSLTLTAIECFSADTAGVQAVIDCAMLLPSRGLRMIWNGVVISLGADTTRFVFHRRDG
jgi:hypothetical protein